MKTRNERIQLIIAKRVWKNTMLKLYPNFSPKKWAMTSYRVKHSQLKI